MNELMHDVINKFHTVNIMCGSLALEIEAGKEGQFPVRERIIQLIPRIEEELSRARRLLIETTELTDKKLNCYHEVEHFFKVIEPVLSFLEAKIIEFKNVINDTAGSLSKKEAIPFLRIMEEKALACGIVLNEFKCSLIKSGKYADK